MIEVKKRKINKKTVTLIVTSAVLALLIVAMIVTNAVIGSINNDAAGQEQQPADYIPEIGESFYGSYALAYESFTQSAIEGLYVDSSNGKYSMIRSKDGYFIYCYEDETGEMTPYYPAIIGEDGVNDFNYSDLYALDESGMIYKTDYLFATLGTLFIGERIALSSDETEREKQLDRYGLSEGERETIKIYKSVTAEGETEAEREIITIEIGDSLLGQSGYYYRVNGRDYVYTSSGTYLDYALNGFANFIKPNLVAEGLTNDGVYEPYYTPNYQQWKNTVTKYDKDLSAELQAVVKKNSKVVGQAVQLSPITDDSYFDDDEALNASDGYVTGALKGHSFDLSKLVTVNSGGQEIIMPGYSELVKLLTSSKLGVYADRNLLATIVSNTLEIDFGEDDSVSYDYKILKIESVITEGNEFAAGYGYERVCDVPDAKMVKVTYDYYIDSQKQNKAPRHAVINLSDLDANTLSYVSEAQIGADVSIDFTYNYDKDTATTHGVKYVISEIAIIQELDENGNLVYTDTINENSIVTFRYYLESDGIKISQESSVMTLISDLKEGNYIKVKDALMGRSISDNLKLVAFEDIIFTQVMQDFISYSFESLDYFVEKELIVSFEFLNPSQRDPYYPETLYKNTLPSTDKHSMYPLNASSCEQVVKLLGGIGVDTSSSLSEGLAGSETVAVGLSADNMEKYGLYANTVYFELPRNIQVINNPDPDALNDYTWSDTLGFTLYISDYNPEDKCRYMASDMYGVIVKIDNDAFDYLDLSFNEFYARRNLILVKYTNIERVDVDFYLEDFYGSYTFDTECYKTDENGTDYDYLTVDVYPNGENSGNKLTDYVNVLGAESIGLAELYNLVYSEDKDEYHELTSGSASLGAASFQDLLLVMFNTNYLGYLTEDEQAAGLAAKKLMSMSVTVKENDYYAERTFTYDFYRIDDRRVMVSLSNTESSLVVSDFYITTSAFKKLIGNYNNILNGVTIDSTVMYP